VLVSIYLNKLKQDKNAPYTNLYVKKRMNMTFLSKILATIKQFNNLTIGK